MSLPGAGANSVPVLGILTGLDISTLSAQSQSAPELAAVGGQAGSMLSVMSQVSGASEASEDSEFVSVELTELSSFTLAGNPQVTPILEDTETYI